MPSTSVLMAQRMSTSTGLTVCAVCCSECLSHIQ
jgi:hypothetical protein